MPFSGTGILREISNNSRNTKRIARGFFHHWLLTSPAYKNMRTLIPALYRRHLASFRETFCHLSSRQI